MSRYIGTCGTAELDDSAANSTVGSILDDHVARAQCYKLLQHPQSCGWAVQVRVIFSIGTSI